MHPINPSIQELFQRLQPVLGRQIDTLWQAYVADPRARAEIESLLFGLAEKHLGENYQSDRILLQPPSEEEAAGEYRLGRVCYDRPLHVFGLRREELARHVSIFGQPGSGKTNVARILIWNLLRDGQPFLVFDWKRNYRHFLARPEGKDILVFTAGSDLAPFTFNPLIPPEGIEEDAYLREVISLLLATYFPELQLLSVQGVEYFLLRAIDGMQSDRVLTLRHLLRWVRAYRPQSREADWKTSALNVLYKLATGPIGEVLNRPQQYPIGRLMERQVVLELDGLGSPKDKSFLTQALLLWIYHHRQRQGKSGFKHLILIEEAHNILRPRSQEGVIEFIFRQVREYGEGIVMIDQHPSLTSIPGIGNTYCTIAMNLKSAQDLSTLAPALLLEGEQKSYLSRLPIGQGIIKLQGRYFKPFLVRFPLVPIGEVSDEEVSKRMEQATLDMELEAVEDAISQLTSDSRPISRIHADGSLQGGIQPSQVSEKGRESGLAESQRAMLIDICQHPFDSITKRYARLGLHPSMGQRVRKSLEGVEFIQSAMLSSGSGHVTLLQLTSRGEALVQGWGVQPTAHGRGGLEHEYWKHKVAEHLRAKGWTIEVEHPIGNGSAIDLVASQGSRRIALEIETGMSDAVENIRKCLAAGFPQVFSVAVSTGGAKKLEEQLKGLGTDDRGKVRVLTVRELLSSPDGG